MDTVYQPELSSKVSCSNSRNNKGLWDGILTSDKGSRLIGAHCKDHYKADRVCDCQMVNSNGSVRCPGNRYVHTYYPLAKKALCCSLCDKNNSLSRTDENSCVSIYQKNNKNIKCPYNKFIKDISLKNKSSGSNINCCSPEFVDVYPEYKESKEPKTDKLIRFGKHLDLRNRDTILVVIFLVVLFLILLGKNLFIVLLIVVILLMHEVDVLGWLKRFWKSLIGEQNTNYRSRE